MNIKEHAFIEGTNVSLCGKAFESIENLVAAYQENPERFTPCTDCGQPSEPVHEYVTDSPRCEADVKDGVCLTRLPSWDATCPNEFIHAVTS